MNCTNYTTPEGSFSVVSLSAAAGITTYSKGGMIQHHRGHLSPSPCARIHCDKSASRRLSPVWLSGCLAEGIGKGAGRGIGRHPVAPNGCGGVKPLSVARPKRAGVSNTDLALSIGHPIFLKVLHPRQGSGGRAPTSSHAATGALPSGSKSALCGCCPGACSCSKRGFRWSKRWLAGLATQDSSPGFGAVSY